MATFKDEDILTKEGQLRQAFVGDASDMSVENFKPARKVTALCADILRRSDNVMLTREFKLSSIFSHYAEDEPEENLDENGKLKGPSMAKEVENPEFDSALADRMPKAVAQFMVVLSCSNENLFCYARSEDAFDEAVFEFMNSVSDAELGSYFSVVFKALMEISSVNTERDKTPEDLTGNAKKKPNRSGSRRGSGVSQGASPRRR